MKSINHYALKPLWDIAEICARHGITHAVLSPGSRCAPLVHGFSHHPDIQCFSIIDERSAGFMAMGIAQQTRKPAVLVCTSGTAGINYFSAISEAFYQNIPLLVLTADRPPELLDQQDGQTIHQREIYGKHVRKSFQLPDDFLHSDKIWHTERLVNEALNACIDFPPKPVHLNIPIREPFYPTQDTKIVFKKDIQFIKKEKFEQILAPSTIQDLRQAIQKASKIIIIAGQDYPNPELCALLNMYKIPILSDIISNTHFISQRIHFQDFTLLNTDFKNRLGHPDLVISFGKSIISKNVKLFLRQYRPKQHWHIQPSGDVADTFKSLTRIIPVSELYFFKNIFFQQTSDQVRAERDTYFRLWQEADQHFENLFPNHFKNYDFSEAEIIFEVMRRLPNRTILHLANSMSVRYANIFNFMHRTDALEKIEIYANRGTSGIDGSNSTAVGHAWVSESLNVLITGDLAFFYDRNAFWNRDLPPNLRIILLNNHGGGIFNMIQGPNAIQGSEKYFTTPHQKQAHFLCQESEIQYQMCQNKVDFLAHLSEFFESSSRPKLLECHTKMTHNSEIWSDLKIKICTEFGTKIKHMA